MSQIIRSEKEIEDLHETADEVQFAASRWPGMTYEQGVQATLDWLTIQGREDPLS